MMHHLFFLAQGLFDQTQLELPKVLANDSQIQIVLEIVFGLAGAIAALIVTIAGFQYVISMGDPQKVAKSKNTIIYALVGLAVALSAFSVVRWVIGRTV